MSTTRTTSVEHAMTRLNVYTGIAFDDFCAAFEKAAPPYNPAPFQQIADDGGSWADVEDAMATLAPHGLIVYARLDTRPMVALSGLPVQAVEYLLGNHVIATSMLRFDSNTLLYAPLRVLVYSDESGDAVFAIDRPATVFAGLDHDFIAATGRLLDEKVLGVLNAVGVDARHVFA